MNLKNSLFSVLPSALNKKIMLPASKSHANRALILGALRGNEFIVSNLPTSSDVRYLIDCLKKVGLQITENAYSVTFHNSFPDCESVISEEVLDLETGDGGTTNRFLLALLSRGKKRYNFFPSEKISQRPIDDLINALTDLKVDVQKGYHNSWISIKGPAIVKDKIEINCQESTQFASALFLAFSNTKLELSLKNIESSKTYIEMTKYLISHSSLNKYEVPVDFSCLSYPAALALVSGSVCISNCHSLDLLQADSKLIALAKSCGGDIEWGKEGLLVTSKNKLSPFNVDGSIFPDLVPTLAFLAAHIEGTSTISNMSVLRFKESDRIEQLIYILQQMGVNFLFDSNLNILTINGKKTTYRKTILKTARDHRMVMTAYLFLRANTGGEIAESDCVEKSFPSFFKIME